MIDNVFFRYLVERAVERLRRQGEAQFAGVSADLEARLGGFDGDGDGVGFDGDGHDDHGDDGGVSAECVSGIQVELKIIVCSLCLKPHWWDLFSPKIFVTPS